MVDSESVLSFPLSSLSYEFRSLVSNLLNTKKILTTTDGDTKLPRDWRGLAFLLKVSSELAASINESQDKTARLLETWVQRNDGTATLGTLLEYLVKLDRYDIHDDIVDLAVKGRLLVPNENGYKNNNEVTKFNGHNDESKFITYDDRRDGFPHYYHAYVLFAQEDWSFVRELMARMKALGFKLCTEYDIDIGYGTQYAPVAQLISERCYRIILVYSPDFLESPANSFYSDYAQAVGIESNKRNIIPIIYRECRLPHNLMYYHRLVYKPNEWAPYDFWEKLGQTLEKVKLPKSNGLTNTESSVSITELTNTEETIADLFLNVHPLSTNSSYSEQDTVKVNLSQLKDSSSTGSEKKKRTKVRQVLQFFTGKPKNVYG